MPTIDQLPTAAPPGAADEIPVEQGGLTRSVTIGALLAGVQAVITAPTGSLLGRTSLGPGGPEPVATGAGLTLTTAGLAANGADHAAYPQRGQLVVSDTAVLVTPAGPAQLPLSTLRGLFAAGQNIAIDVHGVVSAAVPQGPQGVMGPAGAAGARGAGWSASTGAPAATTGSVGDFYLNTANGTVFQKASTGWSQIATLLGPQGATGAAGVAGATGTPGATGTVWTTGAGAPAAGIGNAGDLYLNTTTGAVYQKAGGTWSQIENLTGPAGTGFITGTATTTTLGAADRVGLSQGGADKAIAVANFASLLPVTARIGTATTTPAALMDRFGDLPNVVRDFGAPLNGTDASVAINAAIAAVAGRGGGVVLIPNAGVPYMLAAPVVPLSGVTVRGVGQPTLQLLPGANCAVIESLNYQSLIGTLSNGGVIGSVIEGLTLDGNAASQLPTNPDFANGISFFGPGIKLHRLVVQNVFGHGINLSWGSGNPAVGGVVEGVIDDVFIHNAGRNGLWFIGSHDTSMRDVIVRNASTSGDGAYVGFRLDPGGSLRAHNLHAYNDPAAAQTAYAASIAGYGEFTSCHFEGSHQSVLIQGPLARFAVCQFYNPHGPTAGRALVDLQANNATFVGCGFSLPPPANATTPGVGMYAIAFGGSGTPVSGTLVQGCFFQEFDVCGPFNFVNDGGSNVVDGSGSTTNTAGATAFSGAMQSTTSIDYRQTGTRIVYVSNRIVGDGLGVTGNGVMLAGAASGSPVGLQAVGKDSNVSVFLAPKGAGAISANLPDGTAAGGNVRGSNSFDWQTLRSAPAQVASGFAALIAGGRQNTASGNYSATVGGLGNTADGGYSEAGGTGSHTHDRQASRVWSSGSILYPGDCQKGFAHMLRAVTTTASPVFATSDMLAPAGYNNLQVQPNSAICVRLRVVARDYLSGAAAMFTSPDLLATCGAARSSVALSFGNSIAMTMTQTTGNTSNWGVIISLDGATGGFLVAVTGVVGRTIHWLVDPEFLELS